MVPKPSVVCSLPTSHLISPTLSAPKQRVEGPRAHPRPGQGPPEPRLSAAAPPVALVSSQLPAEAVVFSTRAWWAAGRITLCPGGLFIWVSLHVALTFEVKAVPTFVLYRQKKHRLLKADIIIVMDWLRRWERGHHPNME